MSPTDPLKRILEGAAREALIANFEKLGLQFSNLHPTIRAIMERAAISTGDAAAGRELCQAGGYGRPVQPHRRTEGIRAREGLRAAWRTPRQIREGRRQRSGRGYFAALPDRSVRAPGARWPSRFPNLTVQRL